jgi:hypothetical protein
MVMERRDSAFPSFSVKCVPTRRIKQEALILSLRLLSVDN